MTGCIIVRIVGHSTSMSKTFVTGAAGFLGGWIVESFFLSDLAVRAGVRRWTSAMRLARRPIDIVACDVLDPCSLREAMEGCDTVVHCAVGDDEVTVRGTENVLQAVLDGQLKRVVHISSIAVYGTATGKIDESCPHDGRGNPYAQRKIDAERVCQDYIARGAPVVMLRPTLIYGPYSEQWTTNFAKRLYSGRWGTFGAAGEGTCNLVYVTDVVQAIHAAIESEDAVGEAFNINGEELVTWNEYFRRFNEQLELPGLGQLDARTMQIKAQLLSPIRTVGKYALSRYRDRIMKIYTGSRMAGFAMKSTEKSLKLTPTPGQLKSYGIDAEYTIDKAQQQLGYVPRVDVQTGLQMSVAWLKHHGMLY